MRDSTVGGSQIKNPIFRKNQFRVFFGSVKAELIKLANQLMGECLAKNMIKEANFSKIFSESSQMMLKLGRNMR